MTALSMSPAFDSTVQRIEAGEMLELLALASVFPFGVSPGLRRDAGQPSVY